MKELMLSMSPMIVRSMSPMMEDIQYLNPPSSFANRILKQAWLNVSHRTGPSDEVISGPLSYFAFGV